MIGGSSYDRSHRYKFWQSGADHQVREGGVCQNQGAASGCGGG